jgi:hypothetical protein
VSVRWRRRGASRNIVTAIHCAFVASAFISTMDKHSIAATVKERIIVSSTLGSAAHVSLVSYT